MSIFLRPEQLQQLYAHPGVNDEFSRKVKELGRRLQMNGLEYRNWETLTDHQQGIFSDNLFLDPDCATDVETYVDGAVHTCDCPDVKEDLHHHSPVLMFAIKQQRQPTPVDPDAFSQNESLETYVDSVLTHLLESEET